LTRYQDSLDFTKGDTMTQNQRQLAPLRFAGVLVFAVLLSITNVAAQSRTFNPSPAGSLGLDSQSAVVARTSLTSANWPDIVSGPFEFFSTYSMSKSTGIVTVDCNKGDSINQALTKSPLVRNLTVEISGVCHENVVVTRDHVTLHGTDPANDGIQADLSDEISDVALWVRQAQLVTVENLKLTGGFSGLLVTNVTLNGLQLINCRLESNGAYGAQLQNALVVAQDSTFSTNGNTMPACSAARASSVRTALSRIRRERARWVPLELTCSPLPPTA